jgi:serine/threonine protein kinase
MSNSQEVSLGSTVGGNRIDSVIGRGGMSFVYLAEHLRLERKVALKLIAPDLAEDEKFRARFVRESKLAASLEHPNIIPPRAKSSPSAIKYSRRSTSGRHPPGSLSASAPSGSPWTARPHKKWLRARLDGLRAGHVLGQQAYSPSNRFPSARRRTVSSISAPALSTSSM